MCASINTQTLQDADRLGRTRELLSRSIARMSSGSRIISASDDPAGVGLAEKLSAQNQRVEAATTNVQNSVSFVQSVDGFLSGIGNVLGRMSELAMLASDPMKNAGDIALYQEEFSQLQQQIRNTVGGNTSDIGGTYNITKPLGTFNGKVLFGAGTGTVIATGQTATQRLTIPPTNLRDGAMVQIFSQNSSGVFGLTVSDPTAQQKLAAAATEIGQERATLGAVGSRLELVSSSLVADGEGLTAAISKIRDVDVAAESTHLTKMNLLAESGTAMLAQANQSPRSVLKLLAE